MQAQVGRTGSGSQLSVVQDYYDFLQLFEINPNSAQPAVCRGSASGTSITALVLSIVLVISFVLLSIPRIVAPIEFVVDKFLITVVFPRLDAIKTKKKAKKKAKKTETEIAAVNAAAAAAAATTTIQSTDATLLQLREVFGGANPNRDCIRSSRDLMSVATGKRRNASFEGIELVRKYALTQHTGNDGSTSNPMQQSRRGVIDELGLEASSADTRMGIDGRGTSTILNPMSEPGVGAIDEFGLKGGSGATPADETTTSVKRQIPMVDVADTRSGPASKNESSGGSESRGALAAAGRDQAKFVALRRSLKGHRTAFSSSGDEKEKKVCGIFTAAVKKKTKLRKEKKKKKTAKYFIGFFRKGLVGSIFLLHPLVANTAFKAIHCVVRDEGDDSTSWVVASAPNVSCAGPEHIGVYLIALLTIAISIVGFPIYCMLSLSRSAGWCDREVLSRLLFWRRESAALMNAEKKEVEEEAAIIAEANALVQLPNGVLESGVDLSLQEPPSYEETMQRSHVLAGEDRLNMATDKAGPIHGGLCCKCGCWFDVLVRTRLSFKVSHSKVTHPGRRNAWTSFTASDYKPEFFWFRLVFNVSITLLALANTFLNPVYMNIDSTLHTAAERRGIFVTFQVFRFLICIAAVTFPCVLLISFTPMKLSNRWKLPLRVACALVSVVMLTFNISSWCFPRADLNWFGYIVITLSVALLLLMAILFVIFVVFRGAQLQKRSEDAHEEEEAVIDLAMEVQAYLHSEMQRRIFTAWQTVAVDAITRRESAAADGAAAAATAEAQRAAAMEEALRTPRGRKSSALLFSALAGNEPGLPDGWTTTTDPTDASVIYVHHLTGRRRTTRPAPLPSGWFATKDMAGDVVFMNLETGEEITEAPCALNGGWVYTDSLDILRADEQTTKALPRGTGAGSSFRAALEDALQTVSGQQEQPAVDEAPAPSVTSLYTNTITGSVTNVRPLPLEPGWRCHLHHSGNAFYVHDISDETRWEPPYALPEGWEEHVDETGSSYYHNYDTGATSWLHPRVGEDAIPPASADSLSPAEESSPRSPRSHDSNDTTNPMHITKKKKKKFVTWKERTNVSLAESLFTISESSVSGSSGGRMRQRRMSVGDREIPTYLVELFSSIFVQGNKKGDGVLTTLELMKMLKRRAKGTPLAGDSHAIFSLKTLLAKEGGDASGEHGEIRIDVFARGIMKAIMNQNENVSEWILSELQLSASEWTVLADVDEGSTFYVNVRTGARRRSKPQIVAETERLAELAREGAVASTRSSRGKSS